MSTPMWTRRAPALAAALRAFGTLAGIGRVLGVSRQAVATWRDVPAKHRAPLRRAIAAQRRYEGR